MPKGRTNSVEDLKLLFKKLNPTFELMTAIKQGATVRSKVQYKFKCRNCSHVMNRAGVFCTSYKCENCSDSRASKVTPAKFLERMQTLHPQLECLSTFKGTAYDVKVRCKDCGHKFSRNSQAFLYPSRNAKKTNPCPNCATTPLRKTTKQVKAELADKRPDVKLIGDYLGATKEHTFRSLVCGHKFVSTPDRILNLGNNQQGCNSVYGYTRWQLQREGFSERVLRATQGRVPTFAVQR